MKKGKTFYQILINKGYGKYVHEVNKEECLTGDAVEISAVREHCLDKQKVQEKINR